MFLASSAPSLSSLLKRVSILFKTLLNSFEPDFDDREGDGYEGGYYGECSPCHQVCNVL